MDSVVPALGEEEATLKYALQCVYLPSRSQINKSADEDYETNQQLINTIQQVFNLSESRYNELWEDMYNQCFVSENAVDLTLLVLKNRMHRIMEDEHYFYHDKNFLVRVL